MDTGSALIYFLFDAKQKKKARKKYWLLQEIKVADVKISNQRKKSLRMRNKFDENYQNIDNVKWLDFRLYLTIVMKKKYNEMKMKIALY